MKTTTQVLPAIRYNEFTKRTIWFNSSLVCYQSWTDARNERTKSVIFPNGDQMPEAAMKTLKEVFDFISYNSRKSVPLKNNIIKTGKKRLILIVYV